MCQFSIWGCLFCILWVCILYLRKRIWESVFDNSVCVFLVWGKYFELGMCKFCIWEGAFGIFERVLHIWECVYCIWDCESVCRSEYLLFWSVYSEFGAGFLYSLFCILKCVLGIFGRVFIIWSVYFEFGAVFVVLQVVYFGVCPWYFGVCI